MKRHTKNASKTEKRNKLQLRRETVRVLSSKDLSEVAGGALYLRAQDDDNDTGFSAQCMSGYKL